MAPFMHLFHPPCAAVRRKLLIPLFSDVKEVAVLEISHGSCLSYTSEKGQLIKHCARWPLRASRRVPRSQKYSPGEDSWHDTGRWWSQEQRHRHCSVVILPSQWAAEQIELQLGFAEGGCSVMEVGM